MFNKVPEQDPFAVSNEAEEIIKLFPSFKVSVKFSLPYYDCCLHSFYHFYSLTYVSIVQLGQYKVDIVSLGVGPILWAFINLGKSKILSLFHGLIGD